MDSAATVRIPRQTVARAVGNEPNDTVEVPVQDPQAPIGWPQQDYDPARQQSSNQLPAQQPYPQPRPYPQR
jgi:hypothetical protein